MIEQLPISGPVSCSCPRALHVADGLRDHTTRRKDARPRFPLASPFLGLKIWHRADCPSREQVLEEAGAAEHKHAPFCRQSRGSVPGPRARP